MTGEDSDCKCGEGVNNRTLFLLGAAIVFIIAACVYSLSRGGSLPEKPKKVTIAAVVSHILLGERVPPDDRIIALVRRRSGSANFGRKDLAWYKTKARQGKLCGQDGRPHVIDQKVARYHTVGRFSTGGTQI